MNNKRNEPKVLQHKFTEYEFQNTKTKCPFELISKTKDKHRQVVPHYVVENRYDLAFRDKDGREIKTVIYYPPQIKNHNHIERNSYKSFKFWMIRNFTIIFHTCRKDTDPDDYKR